MPIETLEYIEKLKNQSFIGWSEDMKNAYLTSLISVQKFIENRQNPKETKEPVWTCRICGGHKYHEHKMRTDNALVYNYVCNGCSVVMRDPEKFNVQKIKLPCQSELEGRYFKVKL